MTHTWTSTSRAGIVDLQVVVANQGTAAAEEVYIYAGFDAGNSQVWNLNESPHFGIGVDKQATVTLSLRVPYGKHTRVVVAVVYGGYAVDKSYSEWFDS